MLRCPCRRDPRPDDDAVESLAGAAVLPSRRPAVGTQFPGTLEASRNELPCKLEQVLLGAWPAECGGMSFRYGLVE